MHKTILKFIIVLSVLSCDDDPVCVIPPCACPVAILVTVHAGTSQGVVVGAFVKAAGYGDIPCAGGSASPCLVSGYAGVPAHIHHAAHSILVVDQHGGRILHG